jgi:peptidoglycan/xylan/chitin deacetylase (PgdA/CDA1 family)
MLFSKFKSVPVLCYHKISETSDINTATFRRHLEHIAENGYKTVSAAELYAHMTGKREVDNKSIMLTFDDCHLDNWVNVIPMLEEFGMKGVFFCITGFLHDTPNRPQGENRRDVTLLNTHDSYSNAIKNGDCSQFMSKTEVYDTVYKFGHEVFSHSHSHKVIFRSQRLRGVHPEKTHWGLNWLYREVTDGTKVYERGSSLAYNGYLPDGNGGLVIRGMDERAKFCRNELQKSKQTLEALLNKPCDFFCWPFGEYDRLSMSILEETGYKASFTLERGPNSPGCSPLFINRLEVSGKKPMCWVSKKLKLYSNIVTAGFCRKKFHSKI